MYLYHLYIVAGGSKRISRMVERSHVNYSVDLVKKKHFRAISIWTQTKVVVLSHEYKITGAPFTNMV